LKCNWFVSGSISAVFWGRSRCWWRRHDSNGNSGLDARGPHRRDRFLFGHVEHNLDQMSPSSKTFIIYFCQPLGKINVFTHVKGSFVCTKMFALNWIHQLITSINLTSTKRSSINKISATFLTRKKIGQNHFIQ
jgi:hypothetical protein